MNCYSWICNSILELRRFPFLRGTNAKGQQKLNVVGEPATLSVGSNESDGQNPRTSKCNISCPKAKVKLIFARVPQHDVQHM